MTRVWAVWVVICLVMVVENTALGVDSGDLAYYPFALVWLGMGWFCAVQYKQERRRR